MGSTNPLRSRVVPNHVYVLGGAGADSDKRMATKRGNGKITDC